MDLECYELRSPATLIRGVARRTPLVDGTAHAVVVADPSRAQRIRAVEAMACGSDVSAYDEPRALIEDLCRRWDPGVGSRFGDIAIVTVLARRGLCVWTPAEWAWALAWRYAFSGGIVGGDIITVTEHGWYDATTRHADHRPRLRTRAA